MRQTHPSPFSPRSTHTCATCIDLTRLLRLTLRSRPPAAWTSHHLLVQVLEWRAARVVGAYASISAKGRDRRKRRPASVPPCDGGVRRWPSVRDDRRSTVRRPNHNYRILASQTGETSINILSYLPSHLVRTLRQYLLATIESSICIRSWNRDNLYFAYHSIFYREE